MKFILALALVASASANCDSCKAASGASDEAGWCAYEASSNCGCNAHAGDASCDLTTVNSFRAGCGQNLCGDRRLAETDLEESTTETASWGRRRRRFFDARRRRRRFFDARRRRRRTSYPTPYPTAYPTAYPTSSPTPSPTGILSHNTC